MLLYFASVNNPGSSPDIGGRPPLLPDSTGREAEELSLNGNLLTVRFR